MSYPVGLCTRAFADPARLHASGSGARPILTHIWYPATPLARPLPVMIGPPETPFFWAGDAAHDAVPAASPPTLPLVVLSHGTGGMALQLGWLATALAAQGSIVACVNHHGNTALEPYTLDGFTRIWDRPQDLRVMLDCLLADPLFGPRIDPGRIGAAGFSLGGYTALALAGGVLDLRELLAAYRRAGRSLETLAPPEFPDAAGLVQALERLSTEDASHRRSYHDRRIGAAFVMAPALGEAFSAQGLAPITVPVKIVAGVADTNTPPARNASWYAQHIPSAELVFVDGQVGHYTFLAECAPAGRDALPMLCIDEPGVDRATVHRQVGEMAQAFFARHLPA